MKTPRNLFFCLALISIFAPTILNSQNEGSTTRDPANQFEKFVKHLPSERVYVHLDKPMYRPGETIWFEVYNRDAQNFLPSSISDIARVDLIGPRGTSLKKLNLFLNNGRAGADISIPKDWPGGEYTLRAFTNYQFNDTRNFLFEKSFIVQKVVLPRLKMKLDFEISSYGPGDEVVAEFSAEKIDNSPLVNIEISYRVILNGEEIIIGKTETNSSGKAFAVFKLPENLDHNDGLININIPFQGQIEAISRSIPIVLYKLQLSFFPEGGDLIHGVNSRVAFTTLDENNKPAELKGTLFSSGGKMIETLSSVHDGMGSFCILPEYGESYYVQLDHPGSSKKFYLPKVKREGYAFGIQSIEQNELKLKLGSSRGPEQILLVGQMRGKVLFQKQIEAKTAEHGIVVPTKEFTAGVLQLTLFDSQNIPQSERLVFLHREKVMQIRIQPDKEIYLPREKVILKIQTTDDEGNGIAAQLSMSVANDKLISFADDKSGNILAKMLMEADLQGSVHEPNYYFDFEEKNALASLDLLMMTRGWRRFGWKEVLSEKQPEITFKPERTRLAGIVYSIQGQPLRGVFVTLGTKKTRTNENGEWTLPAVEIEENTSLIFNKEGFRTTTGIVTAFSEQVVAFLAPSASNYNSITSYRDGVHNDDICYSDAGFFFPGIGPMYYNGQEEKSVLREGVNSEMLELGEPLIEEIEPEEIEEELATPIFANREAQIADKIVALEGVHINALNINAMADVQMACCEISSRSSMELRYVNYRNYNGSYIISHVDGMDYLIRDGVTYSWNPNISNGNIYRERNRIPVPGNRKKIKLKIIAQLESEGIRPSGRIYLRMLLNKRGTPEKVIVLQSPSEEMANVVTSIAMGLNFSAPMSNYHKQQNWVTEVIDLHMEGEVLLPQSGTIKSFYRAREFPEIKHENDQIDPIRKDFRQTVYWNGELNTDENGNAEISFYNSDEVNSFRAIAEGFSDNGMVGHGEKTIATQLPFSLSAKIPPEVSMGDMVLLPITLVNNSPADLEGKLKIISPKSWKSTEKAIQIVEVKGGESKTLHVPFLIQDLPGKDGLKIEFEGSGFRDAIVREVKVGKRGYPRSASISGKEMAQAWNINITSPIAGTLESKFTIYPTVLSELVSGTNYMLREPHGCFEQASSSNYPNVVALQFMEESGEIDREIRNQSLSLLSKGYGKLTGYETGTKGYEWFGHSPGHEALTAYGLLQFHDMSKVYAVDEGMIDRTAKWLLSQRNGKGGFGRNSRALDRFGGADENITNAYITYSLAEAGYSNIDVELNALYVVAEKSNDPYLLALASNSFYAVGDETKGKVILEKLKSMQKESGKFEGSLHSITRSTGLSLSLETTSLAAMAMMKSENAQCRELLNAMKFISENRNGNGGYGSTQSTVLSLKAITAYTKLTKKPKSAGKVELYVNEGKSAILSYSVEESGELSVSGWEHFLKSGTNKVQVRFLETEESIPFSIGMNWTTTEPASSKETEISIRQTLSKQRMGVGETVRMKIELKNKSRNDIASPIAIIGIPAGLSIQVWQLKEMKERGAFDFYEIKERKLVLYYRAFEGQEKRILNFDLRAEIPGKYFAPASTAYLYYTPEHKDWTSLGEVEILP